MRHLSALKLCGTGQQCSCAAVRHRLAVQRSGTGRQCSCAAVQQCSTDQQCSSAAPVGSAAERHRSAVRLCGSAAVRPCSSATPISSAAVRHRSAVQQVADGGAPPTAQHVSQLPALLSFKGPLMRVDLAKKKRANQKGQMAVIDVPCAPPCHSLCLLSLLHTCSGAVN